MRLTELNERMVNRMFHYVPVRVQNMTRGMPGTSTLWGIICVVIFWKSAPSHPGSPGTRVWRKNMKKTIPYTLLLIMAALALIVLPVSAVTTPVAAFASNLTTGNVPLGLQFIDESTNSPTSWLWSFGDGGISNDQNPVYTYTNAGTYSVTLTATNTGGSNTVTVVGYITVTKSTLPPVASLLSNVTTGTMPLSVQFIDASKNSPISWTWSFGDGGTSNDQNPSHTYTNAGTYTVTLTATNAGGSDTDTQTGYITVSKSSTAPSAAFTSTVQSGSSPLTVQFVDSSANSPASWLWTFGDGSTSIVQNPSHTYANSGIYTVTLTVTNSGGSDTVSRSGYITVAPTVPGTSFTANVTSGTAPLYVQFMDNSTNSPASWYWYFGDGGSSTLQDPVYSYLQPGTYAVELIAGNSAGSNTSTVSGYITVAALAAPVPLFSSNVTSGPSPLPVQFYDNSSNYPTSWLWSFGDGTTSSVQNPMHIFSGDGTYAVTLTAMNAGGNRMTASPGYITVSEATATPAPTTPYATVSPEGTIIAPEETTVAVAPDVTVANVSAPVSTGSSSLLIPVIGIIAALLVCGAAFVLLRRSTEGSHGHRRRDL